MPSPVPDRPGLLIRDPFHYSDATLIVPPALVECLQFFDGQRTDLDLRAALVQLTGDLQVSGIERHLVKTLSDAGFLEDEAFARMKADRRRAFVDAAERQSAHCGSAYPADAAALRTVLCGYMNGGAAGQPDSVRGIAAPHVSPEGGWQAYQAAYGRLGPSHADRIFVILGTSHYGQPERFGLTRKSFLTPLGSACTEQALVDRLESDGGRAVEMEDYCHAVEHSIEFQVVFLQHLCGPEIRILPVLCGPFVRSVHQSALPEEDEKVKRFFGALGELAAREGDRLVWVLGVDMAHMGRRYGDPFAARAGEGRMTEVEELDRKRIERIVAADAEGFWAAIQENRDALKWCGAAPFYTFLKANPGLRGELLRYQQWNIDDQSVVSFAGMSFV